MSFDDCFEEEQINKGFAALRGVDAPDPRQAIAARLQPKRNRLIPALSLAAAVAACVVFALVLRFPQPVIKHGIASVDHKRNAVIARRMPKPVLVAMVPPPSDPQVGDGQPSGAGLADAPSRRFFTLSYRDKETSVKPRKGDICINSKDGAVMVWVPAGRFLMGSSDKDISAFLKEHPEKKWTAEAFADETPQHEVRLSGYWIYKCEVTVKQYRQFCEETGRTMPVEPAWGWQDDYPIMNVRWDDAAAYAEWAGASLPTEAQWEKAARGTDGRLYPWGNEWDASRCGETRLGEIHPVGSIPTGASPYGCMDMAGNAAEWCSDYYQDNYYSQIATGSWIDPKGPATGTERALRGGGWYLFYYPANLYGRSACRSKTDPEADEGAGFRLAR